MTYMKNRSMISANFANGAYFMGFNALNHATLR